MNLWHKMTNMELGTRIPLVVRAPFAQGGGAGGHRVPANVEAVDIFPSVVALALGTPVDPAEGLQGYDFSSLFAAPPEDAVAVARHERAWRASKPYAFSQFAKAGTFSKELKRIEEWDVCTTCTRSSIDVQYSIRSESWRYTIWVGWNQSSWRPIWDDVRGQELYDHSADCRGDFDCDSETENVFNASAAHRRVSAQLLAAVRVQFDGDHKPPQARTAAKVDDEPHAGCASDLDCMLNGACTGGRCHCDRGWRGDDCGSIAARPTAPDLDTQRAWPPANGASSWGGNSVYDSADKNWHLFVSPVDLECGMDCWNTQQVRF